MNDRDDAISIEPCPAARDAEAGAFLREVFYNELGFTPDPYLDKDFQSLCGHYRRGRGQIWIASENGCILATTALLDLTLSRSVPASASPEILELAMSGGDAELKRMFVARKARGRGIGKRLLEVALTHATASGFERVVLDSTRDMRVAIDLYKAFGFEEIPDYNGNSRADIFMALVLPGGS
ncbi:MAG: GNAT family N-acetyltransferase [Polyangiaceae bacterium]|nr:GNAT family N-acetyltransferase [Polyangiaceae bacterium]NUQ74525.1 GNAT family N-acetyltransferase [Polyangiaceae bacterium]